MWRVTLTGLLAKKFRLVLTSLAVVLGVAFMAGTLVLTDTLASTVRVLASNGTQLAAACDPLEDQDVTYDLGGHPMPVTGR